MIQLYQFPTGLGVPNLSPFCMKVETWLRLAGLEYEIKWQPDPRKAPLGKLPYIRDGGRAVADSHSIVEYLTATYGVKLDAGLGAEHKAVAHAVERMLNEHTYWGMIYSRWIAPEGWARFRQVFFGTLPPGVRTLVSALVQRKVRRDAWGQGLVRHGEDEIYRRVGQDIQAVADLLGSKPYLLGDQPTGIDATVYAYIGNFWQAQLETPIKALVGRHPNLIAYSERMKQRCYPDRAKKK